MTVEALQVNLELMARMEAAGNVSTGQTSVECQECDESSEATHLCKDCNLLLCDDCCTHHKKVKKSKHHVLLPVTELQEHRQTLSRANRMCKTHTCQELRLYCNTCSTIVCPDGIITEHKGHDYVPLTDVVM